MASKKQKAGKKPAGPKLYKVPISEASGKQLTAMSTTMEQTQLSYNAAVAALLTEKAPPELLEGGGELQFLGVRQAPDGSYELHATKG